MIDSFLQDIETHFSKEYPREGCGILYVKKGKLNWEPCTNIAKGDEEFVIDSTKYLQLHRTSDIVGIVHSHPDASAEASDHDIASCNTLGIPYYIFSYPEMDFNLINPNNNLAELYGREYSFGITDCFEAARDYLASQNINIASRILFEDDWWEKGLDYFTEDMMNEWGFQEVEVSKIEKNDVLTFSVGAPIANHCGVYIGNDSFYHHAINRLSCRESLYPFWAKNLNKAYRYVA